MKKVLVIGDSCRDIYLYGKCDRLSPEAPVPVLKPLTSRSTRGMAANVYANLQALGIDADLITNTELPIKTRYVDEVSNQMLLRVDENDLIEPIEYLKDIDFKEYSAVVISDYNKGFLSKDDIEYISKNHKNTFLDSKKTFGDWCSKIKFIKINEKEYLNNSSFLDKHYHGHLIVTRGKRGATLDSTDGFLITEEHPVRDLSGAGDTFFAALVAYHVKNNDICEAIKFANKCASWVVTQKGVVVVDVKKINL